MLKALFGSTVLLPVFQEYANAVDVGSMRLMATMQGGSLVSLVSGGPGNEANGAAL